MFEGLFEAEHLLVSETRAFQRRVDGGVEDHPADLLREEVGVHPAQRGAVGEAKVVELLVSHKAAQNVHVARRRLRADMREQLARLVLTALGKLFCLSPLRLPPLRGGQVKLRVEVLPQLGVAQTIDRGRGTDPARIETHDVVFVAKSLAEDPVCV